MQFGQVNIKIAQISKRLFAAHIGTQIAICNRFAKLDEFFVFEWRITRERVQLCIVLCGGRQWTVNMTEGGLFNRGDK